MNYPFICIWALNMTEMVQVYVADFYILLAIITQAEQNAYSVNVDQRILKL